MKYINLKKFLSFVIAFALLLTVSPTAFASDEAATDAFYNSPEHIKQIEESNKRIEEYMNNKITTYSGSRVSLNVNLYQQETSDTCSIASMQMVIQYKKAYYSQSTILSYQKSAYAGNWNYVYAVAGGLTHYGLDYDYASTSSSDFTNSIIYSLDNGNPVICPVKTAYLPNYTDGTNNGHYVVVTGYYAGYSGSSYSNELTYNDPHWNDKYFGTYTCEFTEMKSAVNAHSGYFIRGN